MLQDIEADDRVDVMLAVSFDIRSRDVKVFDYKLLVLSKGIFKKGEILRLHIRCYDKISIQE